MNKGERNRCGPRCRDIAPKRDTDDSERHIHGQNSGRRRTHRLGGLRQGHLHRHGGDDAFGAGRRARGRPDRLHARLRRLRKAVPDAGFLPDFRAVSTARDRPRLAPLSRPQGRALRLFLCAVGDDPVRLQGAGLRGRNELGSCRISLPRILYRAVRHALVHLSSADLLRCHKTDTSNRAALDLGLAGACAIVTIGTLLARMNWLTALRFCGEHSIVIYLAFFLPMATTRTVLLKTGLIPDIGVISLVVTAIGVVGAVLIWRAALAVGANVLFERPAAFWIAPKKK